MAKMDGVILYFFQDEGIKISIELYFNEHNALILYGYDIGKSVEEFWGDSDYEYSYTIQPKEVEKLYALFEVSSGDKAGLLEAIRARFGVNEAYSLFGAFMTEHDVQFEAFTWS